MDLLREPLTPLRFTPILRRALWGGRKLATHLGKTLGEGMDYAESWEVCDLDSTTSRVSAGPLIGTTLRELVVFRGRDLLGRHHPRIRFPLLFKFLDARETLSVQVHPDDARAGAANPCECGKSEAWVVLDAEPNSLIYSGLKPGVDRESLEHAAQAGRCESYLHCFQPRPQDCIYVPAGVPHALGAGMLVAEIQQASDATYRLFDWNRKDSQGQSRALHVESALDTIDYDRGPVVPNRSTSTDRRGLCRLVECQKFVLDRWSIDAPREVGGDGRCHLLAVLAGNLKVQNDPAGEPLAMGGTVLLPAAAGPVSVTPGPAAVFLDMYLP